VTRLKKRDEVEEGFAIWALGSFASCGPQATSDWPSQIGPSLNIHPQAAGTPLHLAPSHGRTRRHGAGEGDCLLRTAQP
jgi:hypothetical protein